MKAIILTLFVSLPLWALSPENSVKELEKINQSASAVNCTEDADDLYTPLEAIKDINAGKLTFLGRALFPGNDQNYTCVYKSETAYIIYNNCMSSKKESAATDLEVLSFKGGMIGFTILNKTALPPASETVRAEYNSTWRVTVNPSPAVSSKLSMAELKKLVGDLHESRGSCLIGRTFEAQKLDAQVICLGGLNNPTWKAEAEKFWREPTEEWYKSLKYLRQVVVATKF